MNQEMIGKLFAFPFIGRPSQQTQHIRSSEKHTSGYKDKDARVKGYGISCVVRQDMGWDIQSVRKPLLLA